MTDENFVGHRGLLIGKVEKANKNRLGFRVNHKIARYDGIQIDVKGEEKPFGFGVKNLFINGKSQFEANKGEFVEVELPLEHPFLKEGADVYLSSSSDVKGRYDYKKPKPKEYQNLIGIDVAIEVYKDKIWAMSEGTSVFVEGAFDKAKDVKKVNEGLLKEAHEAVEKMVAKFDDKTKKWSYDFGAENLEKIKEKWGIGIEAIELLLEAAASAGYDIDWGGMFDDLDIDDLDEDIDAYFAREVLPYAPDAWIDKSKTKVGYEIPMTRYFYEYKKPESSDEILSRIIGLEDEIAASLKSLFGKGN